MGFEGREQQIDELGRCPLHPAMQLQHYTTRGEWRELLSECPLCVSGLPATALGRPNRTPERQQVQTGMIRTSPVQKVEGNVEEIERFVVSRRDTLGRDKKNNQTSRISEKANVRSEKIESGDNDELQPCGNAPRNNQSRSNSRWGSDETDANGSTPSEHSKATARLDVGNYSNHKLNNPSLSQPPHPQAELLRQNTQVVTKRRAKAADRNTREENNELEAISEDNYDNPNRHSVEQQLNTEYFLPQIGSRIQGQIIEQEFHWSENPFPSSPQHIDEPSMSNQPTMDPHGSSKTPIEDTGSVSSQSQVQIRPDPSDIEELESVHHQTNPFYPSAPSLPSSAPRVNKSPPPWNGGRHPTQNPIQNPNQHSDYQLRSGFTTDSSMSKVLEQDEVSVMTMSSVTQQMHSKLHMQKQRHRQEPQRDQLEEVESDDESSTTSTDSDDVNGKAPSAKSSVLTSKVSDMCETKSASSSSSADLGVKINTCDYDERGWCRRHPTTVHLRKKNIFRSSWQVLLSHCPECCLDEMKRVRDLREKQSRKKGGRTNTNVSSGRSESGETSGSQASSRGGRSSGGGKKTSRRDNEKKKKSIKTNKNPPISQLNLRSTKSSGGSFDHHDDARSVGTASTVTNSSHTQSTGGRLQSSTNLSPGSPNGSANDIRGDYAHTMIAEHSGENDGGSTAHVTRMPYIDKYGAHGWYTGQVDPSTGTPHGVGTMNYANGAVCYSEWNYGMSANPPTEIQEEPFLLGGGGGYSYPRHPRYHYSSHRSPMGHVGRSYLATLTEDGTSSDHEYADGPPSQQHHQQQQQQQQQHQSTVVCGMKWTDQCGNTGAYTGEVNFLCIPHGIGSMRYDQGDVSEGIWRNGEIVGNDSNSEKYRSSSSSPSSSSSSSSEEGQRRVGAGSYLRGPMDNMGY